MKLKYIFSLLIGIVAFSACDLMNNIDEIRPQYQLDEENYITTPKSAEQALNGVYQGWRAWGISPFRVHVSVLSGGLTANLGVSGIEGFSTNEVVENNIAVQDFYSANYAIINAANYLIEALEAGRAVGIDSVRNVEIIGECKFHRAMAHFMLLRQFGQFYDEGSDLGIVLRKAPYRSDTPIAERDKVADCYVFILQDLEEAAKTVPEFVMMHDRVSRLTAKALMARVLLYQKNYPEAARIAQEVINEAPMYGYELEYDDWTQLFQKHYMHSETLFAPYTEGNIESCNISIDRTTVGVYTASIANAWAAQAGIPADSRYEATFQSYMSLTGNGKYPYRVDEYSGIGNGYIFMRLAEVYLIHAEAEARQGASHYAAARASLKVVTDRAGYPETLVDNIPDNELLEAIRQHKWLELVAENGEEWFDLVRYTANGDLEYGAVKSTLARPWQLVLPIPEKALSGNKLLEQNPEY